jgi:hypothetical protein
MNKATASSSQRSVDLERPWVLRSRCIVYLLMSSTPADKPGVTRLLSSHLLCSSHTHACYIPHQSYLPRFDQRQVLRCKCWSRLCCCWWQFVPVSYNTIQYNTIQRCVISRFLAQASDKCSYWRCFSESRSTFICFNERNAISVCDPLLFPTLYRIISGNERPVRRLYWSRLNLTKLVCELYPSS